MKLTMNPPLKRILGPLNPFRSELNCEKDVFKFRRCIEAKSFVFADTTNLTVVSKPVREHLSSIFSSVFGSVLNVAFSGFASVFFVDATYDFPSFFHFPSAGRINICTIAPSPSPIFDKADVTPTIESLGKALYRIISIYCLFNQINYPTWG